MKVWVLASQVLGFVKIGGFGSVAFALPLPKPRILKGYSWIDSITV